jgi:hypothetical protein
MPVTPGSTKPNVANHLRYRPAADQALHVPSAVLVVVEFHKAGQRIGIAEMPDINDRRQHERRARRDPPDAAKNEAASLVPL